MFSYWEQESFSHYQHIVVGAGIVGLSAAIELKGQYAHDSVLVLERGLLPTGASTRNAGFACMGSAKELLDDLDHNTEEEVVRLFEWRKKGLELLRSRLGDERIGYAEQGSYELISTAEQEATAKIHYLNNLLSTAAGKPAFRLANDKISRFGFSKGYTRALIENTCEGSIHSGKMMRALTDMALQKGVEVKTGAVTTGYEEDNNGVTVMVQDNFRQHRWPLTCDTFTICTNAFAKDLVPEADVIPGRGQVLITHPIPGLQFKGIFHFNKGYYYFREIDGRVLLGGGRNLDFAGETTTDFGLSELIQGDLERKLAEIILPGQKFSVNRRWAGIMAFGRQKLPIVQAFSPRVFGAFRMGGMGVALGSLSAKQVVALIAEQRP
ncbi:MAG: FAD-binding oxidoreductase [Taibaiella sp.]|nr:FAD-binding oxidoreductase [Taibaiella sp.]